MCTTNHVHDSQLLCGTGAQASAASSAPPKMELVLGRKWTVENHKGNRALIIDQTDPKQSVYIFNCHNSTVQVMLCIQEYSCNDQSACC